MRKVHTDEIINTIKQLCMDSNYNICDDIFFSIENNYDKEESQLGKDILLQLKENALIAKEKRIPICQDTGMVVIFFEIGQDIQIIGGGLTDAINEGVRQGYKEGYLRNSIVSDPIIRKNTNDNTPAVIHYDIVPGDKIKISVSPKGFGSENMSRIYMLKPSDSIEGVKQSILETVKEAGGNSCPPIIVGVGIGGTFEMATFLSKKALLRPIDENSKIPYIKDLEKELLEKINSLGIGPAGLGGRITALGINIEIFPTHIAGLPVAINIGCHATRHSSQII